MGLGAGGGSFTPQQNYGGGKGTGKGAQVDPNNVSMLSIPKQTKFFVDRIRLLSDQSGERDFEYDQLVTVAKQINLQVGDFRMFIDKLNAQGILLKKPNKVFQLL